LLATLAYNYDVAFESTTSAIVSVGRDLRFAAETAFIASTSRTAPRP